MAGQLTKLLIFLVSAHLMFFLAGQAGLVQFQEEENPHREFIEVFEDGELEESVDVQTEDSGVLERITEVFLSIPVIQQISELLFGPYMVVGNLEIPWVVKTFIQAVIGIIEFTTLVILIRGVNI
ncbi:MAG: hypothetical protein EF811_04960 [Methanonatronarchaeia archaeon]|nr:MAG: hypothetical protein EF811_04960 [Methanonatronarchaeia archaeon]